MVVAEDVRALLSAASSLHAIKSVLVELDVSGEDDSARLDAIRLLEEIKGAAAAAQARVTTEFVASRRAAQQTTGVPAERVGRGIAHEVGLARRISPWDATRYVGQAQVLTRELPETFAQLESGRIPEWRVLQVARQTAWLSAEHRAQVDSELAPQLEQLGNRRTVDLTNKLAYRLDPHGYLARLRNAESERRVSLRPAPDCMTVLSALLPMKQGVAAYAALKAHADTHVGVGDDARTRGQVMADTLVERLTGQATADEVSVTVNLIMTDQTLFTSGEHPDEPATVVGTGAVPADLARRMVRDTSGDTEVFVRRLYRHPTTGELAAMDSTARTFTANQRHFLLLRDQVCRTPWCEAPIRHHDHVVPAESGGPTDIENGQGLCEACNYAKQAPGWQQSVDQNDGTITTTTPTGHRYRSRPPDRVSPCPADLIRQRRVRGRAE